MNLVENKATLLSSVADHKVYALPLDKMPCHVTDIRTLVAIPNAVPTFSNNMPNALEEKQVIPSASDQALTINDGNR